MPDKYPLKAETSGTEKQAQEFQVGDTVPVDAGGTGSTTTGGAGLNLNILDVLEFGDDGSVKDRFLNNAANDHKSFDSSPLALNSGQVVHVSISTEKDAANNWYLQVIKNAVKGGAGVFAGGTQIGTDIEKPAAQLDILVENLSGFTFAKGDRIAAYAKKGETAAGEASEPVIRLFVCYD